jgi:hypothetical protein
MPTPEERTTTLRQATVTAQAILKTGALLGLGLYVVGLVAFNTFLVKYGVTDFNPLKARCILAGAWTITILALAAAPAFAFRYRMCMLPAEPRLKRLAISLVYMVLATFFASGALGLLLNWIPGPPVPRDFETFDTGLPNWPYLLGWMTVTGVTPISEVRINFADPAGWVRSTAQALTLPAIGGVFIVGYSMCEVISPQIGGGRPVPAIFYFNSEAKDLVAQMKRETKPFHDHDEDGYPLAIAVELVYAEEKQYIIRVMYCTPPPHPTLSYSPASINADIVQAVRFSGAQSAPIGSNCPSSEADAENSK